MTLKEIQDWIGTNNYVTTSYRDIDSCGNEEETRIFESNGKLYVIEFQNDHPYEKYGKMDMHGVIMQNPVKSFGNHEW